jgi:hypothetical protein
MDIFARLAAASRCFPPEFTILHTRSHNKTKFFRNLLSHPVFTMDWGKATADSEAQLLQPLFGRYKA